MTNCIGDCGSASGYIQLDEDIAQVAISGAWADDEGVSNFTVGMAFGDQAQDLQFSLRQVQMEYRI